MDSYTTIKRLQPNSALFFFLITLAAIFDFTFGFLPIAGFFFTFLFNTIVGIQLLLAGYGTGIMRLMLAQAVILLLELVFPPLPSSIQYLVVHNIFNSYAHHRATKKAASDNQEASEDEIQVSE